MKFGVLVRWRRGQCLYPHTTPALSDDDVAPVRGLSHRGATVAGLEPPRASAFNWAFLQSQKSHNPQLMRTPAALCSRVRWTPAPQKRLPVLLIGDIPKNSLSPGASKKPEVGTLITYPDFHLEIICIHFSFLFCIH